MLEAERAGAKALVVFMDEHARNGESWKVLRSVQADEAHNCALIGRLLEKEGAAYSHATGEYLVRGLKWAVKRLEEAAPTLGPEARDVFAKMRDSHLRSIAACERVLQALPR